MTSPQRPTVTPEDAARADGVLLACGLLNTDRGAKLLRGAMMAAFADCRADAYADALADHRAASSDPDRGIGCWPPAHA